MLPWMFFGTTSQFTRVVKFVREHPGLNCFVVDVKDNNGRIPQVPGGNFEIPSKSAGYEHFPRWSMYSRRKITT